ncbi:MAG: hypothetical protein RDU25_02905 [Patescibacteria group bacterium]|nr:hypothetical protein [Patescibacteria group bacterium]
MSALSFLNIPNNEFDVFEDEPLDEIQASGFRVIDEDEKDEDEADDDEEGDDLDDEAEADDDEEDEDEEKDPDAVMDEPVDGLKELDELAEKFEDMPLNIEVEYED